LDLRNLTPADAAQVAARISSAADSSDTPREDVPYHDLYWSRRVSSAGRINAMKPLFTLGLIAGAAMAQTPPPASMPGLKLVSTS